MTTQLQLIISGVLLVVALVFVSLFLHERNAALVARDKLAQATVAAQQADAARQEAQDAAKAAQQQLHAATTALQSAQADRQTAQAQQQAAQDALAKLKDLSVMQQTVPPSVWSAIYGGAK